MFARRFGQALRVAGGLVVATVALAAAAFASPGANERADEAAREGGEFRVGMSSIFVGGTIDPALFTELGTGQLLNATCAYLLNVFDKPLPAGLRLVPEVAADHPVSSRNGRTYTFTIRKGFRFSTGAPVTARDFAASLNRILNPALDVPFRDVFLGVAGAQRVLDGKATTASGVIVQRGKLIVRLTKPDPTFPSKMRNVCVLPASFAKAALDPEGVRAPVPSAGPYFISEFVLGERVVLERNRFYGGRRPHHVDRFVVTLENDSDALFDQVERGESDYAFVPSPVIAVRAQEFRKKYGVNKGQFWVQPGQFLRMFVLNTSRPLFRNNVKLRQAVNFAVDRAALLRERGGSPGGTLTDQYLMPTKLGFRDERVYPLRGPDLTRANALAKGRTRSGKAVLYACSACIGSVAQGQIITANLKQIGIEVEAQAFPASVLFAKLATPSEPFDIGWIGWLDSDQDPRGFLEALFDGRTIANAPNFANWSYFNSARYNRLLDRAAQLTGEERYRAYGDFDVQISRDAAPAIPYAYDNALTLVSARTGCVIVNPSLDLAAVCLK